MMERSFASRSDIVWCTPAGQVVACTEKLKVLRENLEEIRLVCQDALEDAVLMGCDEKQVRAVFAGLIDSLENPYPSDESQRTGDPS